MNLVVKSGSKLTQQELNQINQNKFREWQIPTMSEEQVLLSTFFLLKEGEEILAQGQLVDIPGVKFKGQTFNLSGVGGIIASQKGQGFGKQLMTGIKDYLIKNNLIGVGFTGDQTIEFYRKSGFLADQDALKRFVHLKDGQRVTNKEDWVFYQDSTDKFMEKVLENPDLDVLLPRDPDW